MKDKNGNEIFEFQGNKYNFMVGFDEESKLLKLTMIDIKTKQGKRSTKVFKKLGNEQEILKDGDIIAIDVGATYGGMVGDSAWSYAVGKISDEKAMLMKATEEALFAGIEKMRAGNVLDDISGAVEDVAAKYNLGIVRQYGGHGVGHTMHEDPFLFNYRVGDQTLIKAGMVIAIEPMLNLGGDEVFVEDDHWGVVTKDRKPSAHFEHTVLATDDKPVLMTTLQS